MSRRIFIKIHFMQRLFVLTVVLLFTKGLFGQDALTLNDSIGTYFEEVKNATRLSEKLWDKDIYGPILIVNATTRSVYSNYADTAGALKQDGKIYTGVLPVNIPMANASIKWNGINWAMILLHFIPKTKEERINLFAHELFHRSQASLGFTLSDANNNHLNQKDGRIYLRLELEALKKALQAPSKIEMKRHLTNAFIFRKHRHSLFAGADSTENVLELNEGIAEYTGTMISGRNKTEITAHFIRKIDELMTNATFVRTFPYRTIAVYGYLLKDSNQYWNKEITMKTNLTDYFIKEFKIDLPGDIKIASGTNAKEYNAEQIIAEETAREENTKKMIAEYKMKFIEKPHFEIQFEKKKVSFDSRYLLPLEEYGVVYPTLIAYDNWGILTVENGGGLMSADRSKITITAPLKTEGNEITGEGWILKLNEGYELLKKEDGNYTLIKK
jgi:hypothetical protein